MKKVIALVLALVLALSLACVASAEAHAYVASGVLDLEGNVLEVEVPEGALLFNDETFEFALNFAGIEVEGVLEIGEYNEEEKYATMTATIGEDVLTFTYYDEDDAFAMIDEENGLVYVFTAVAAE